MKKRHQLLLLTVLCIGYSCTTQNKENKANDFTKCDTNLKPKDTLHITKVNKDSILFAGVLYTNVNLFEHINDKTYTVKDDNHKVLLKKMKHFSRINGGFQALNDALEIEFYDLKLKKLNQSPKPEFLGFCGNVSGWKVKIEERKDYYLVQKLEGHSGNYGSTWQNIDSIPKLNSKDIYFLDKTKSIEFDANVYYPETIIIAFENSMGIRKNKKTFIFDTVDISSLKVGCNGLFGYFEKTEIKYKKLKPFEYNLASFELLNGRKGYIDRQGNEYYK